MVSTPRVEKVAQLSGHRDSVYALARGADEAVFYSAGGDGTVARWDLQDPTHGQTIAQVPASVYALRWHDARQHLWVGQNFDGIHVIDPAQRRQVASLRLTAAAIFDVQFWQELALVALADGTLAVLDAPRLAVRRHLKASDRSARCVAMHPTRPEVAVGYSDHLIRVFSLPDLLPLHALAGHANSVFTLAYAPDGRTLLSGGRDARLLAWEVDRGYALRQSIPAHLYALNHLTFSPDEKLLATASMDKSVKIWDADTLVLRKVIDRGRHAGHGTSVNRLLWMPYRDQLVSASDDRTLSVWQLSANGLA